MDAHNGHQTPCAPASSATDTDNNIETAFGYDSLGRLTSTQEAVGSAAQRNHLINYHDDTLRITVKQDLYAQNDLLLTNVVAYDRLGRVRLTKQLEASGQSPDNDTDGHQGGKALRLRKRGELQAGLQSVSGRDVRLVDGEHHGVTLVTADTDGRAVSSATFGGAGYPAPFGGNGNSTGAVATAYTAVSSSPLIEVVTVTDEAQNPRASGKDAVGRLAQVIEYPGGGATYTTSYAYDALDDLTAVNQSGQLRSFAYDSLKRLWGATNPETYSANSPAALGCAGGTYAVCYSYDGDGNLLTKTDNRAVTTTYVYDGLNRMVSKSYNDGTTLGVNHSYDNAGANSIGQLTTVGNTSSSTSYGGFDALQRPGSSAQTTTVAGATNTYTFGYTYYQSGSLASETYPSGRVVNTWYDLANRVAQVGLASCSAGVIPSYASGVTYAVHGAPTQYVMGNNGLPTTVWYEASYNSRLQMQTMQDLVDGTTPLLSASLNFGGAQNNGNLLGSSYVNTGGGLANPLTFTQTYGYDGVNRLLSVTDSGYARQFVYDAYGNMYVSNATGIGTGNSPTAAVYNGNNQFNAGTGITYDQAGNEKQAYGNTLGYDGESRQTNVTGAGVNETYVYDGLGKRVAKYASGGAATVFVYDAQGRMAAEYATAVDTPNCVTCYLSADQLGTARLVTDQNGNVVSRHDYLPFGEEIAANQAGRGAQRGPGGDSIRQKFTGKERDQESGLDYLGARYYGSALGRFTSADPKLIPDEFDNPQSWNKYAYTGNNPLRYTDPDGKDWKDVVSGAANAVWSDNAFGAGRQSGNSDFRTGQAIGDGVAFAQGGLQMLGGAAGDAGGGLLSATGIGAVLGVPAIAVSTAVGVDGVGVAGTAAGNLITAASATGPDKVHGNTAGNQPAERYEKTDKDGNLEKHGVSQDASKRYSKAEVGEGNVTVTDRGPRKEMLAKEREKVETNPGPKNREPWAGKKKDQ